MSATRSKRGSLTEFGPALVIFVVFFFVPLIDLGVLPIRYAIAYGAINQFVHHVSLAEKMSDADKMLKAEKFWSTTLTKCGVEVSKTQLALKIVNKADQETQVIIPEPAPIPKQWQPDGAQGPFLYYLVLTADTKISPLFMMNLPWKGIPGLTAPCSIRIESASAWENLGRDPNSQQIAQNEYPYYMNE